MKKRFSEWISMQIIKKPGRIVIGVILLFNVLFLLLSAAVISGLSLDGTEKMGFVEAAFCTITMILDAGCIQFVVSDIGKSGVFITLVCLCIILVGMISFTGAVIGYVTNYISNFIENATTGNRKPHLSNHFVILNWNNRASEIVNDMLYSETPPQIVVLVPENKERVIKEIEERLTDTIARENQAILKSYSHLPFISRHIAGSRKWRRRTHCLARIRSLSAVRRWRASDGGYCPDR